MSAIRSYADRALLRCQSGKVFFTTGARARDMRAHAPIVLSL
jgi:hypothetical protein